ncbi:hypothetical protein DFQ01_103180 [Paenibacillus cellulosilyticus]|uniref:Uncharacterized protein n=1 Tax=Paenibacillus cellulosilyticus TaxID=375489 RepID=A0A2V2YWT8_9BACL|nr:hypothetical protein DFQ01_103180 [Paenibacillus cellulosilyticus]
MGEENEYLWYRCGCRVVIGFCKSAVVLKVVEKSGLLRIWSTIGRQSGGQRSLLNIVEYRRSCLIHALKNMSVDLEHFYIGMPKALGNCF